MIATFYDQDSLFANGSLVHVLLDLDSSLVQTYSSMEQWKTGISQDLILSQFNFGEITLRLADTPILYIKYRTVKFYTHNVFYHVVAETENMYLYNRLDAYR